MARHQSLWARAAVVGGFVVCVLAVVGCGRAVTSESPAPMTGQVGVIESADDLVELCLRIADEAAERSVGLMNVESLDPFDGMLFVFDEPGLHWFWMKDTLIPLELIPVRYNGELSEPIPMQPCTADNADDCPRYGPDFEYVQALELDEGRLAAEGLTVLGSDPVRFRLTDAKCGASATATASP